MVAYCSLTSSYREQRCHSMCSAFGFYKLWCKGSKLLDYISPDLIYWAVNDIEIALYENTEYEFWCWEDLHLCWENFPFIPSDS